MGEKVVVKKTRCAESELCFLVTFGSEKGERLARLVIESLRSFGGQLSQCPVWAFVFDPARLPPVSLDIEGVQYFHLAVEEAYRGYTLAEKVAACAQAEERWRLRKQP